MKIYTNTTKLQNNSNVTKIVSFYRFIEFKFKALKAFKAVLFILSFIPIESTASQLFLIRLQ